MSTQIFLSTLSLRRATGVSIRCVALVMNFYPRSPCGERLAYILQKTQPTKFLSTLSLRRATSNTFGAIGYTKVFLSTLSLRRATRYGRPVDVQFVISIHALLAESDAYYQDKFSVPLDISIHALLAESDVGETQDPKPTRYFYPRSPCGERRPDAKRTSILHHFYPRSPCGERRRGGIVC